MAKQEKNCRKVLLDVKDANLRSHAGTTIQTIPKEWLRRRELQPFFKSNLEIALILVDGEPHIEIRRKQWAMEKTSDHSPRIVAESALAHFHSAASSSVHNSRKRAKNDVNFTLANNVKPETK